MDNNKPLEVGDLFIDEHGRLWAIYEFDYRLKMAKMTQGATQYYSSTQRNVEWDMLHLDFKRIGYINDPDALHSYNSYLYPASAPHEYQRGGEEDSDMLVSEIADQKKRGDQIYAQLGRLIVKRYRDGKDTFVNGARIAAEHCGLDRKKFAKRWGHTAVRRTV